MIKDSIIENGVSIEGFTSLDGVRGGEGAKIGPFSRMRPKTVLEKNVKIGNFVELKNTTMGEGSKANHLTYIGDAEVGSGVNIGAGTITCNYDGKLKYRTTIGDGAFIGSNTEIVAPVTIGKDAYIGAGSTITRDVPEGALRSDTDEAEAHRRLLKEEEKMCGIVGYLGEDEAYPILIEALKRLEYRGYDSAGIAVSCDGRIEIARQKGKVDELRKVCEGGFKGSLGLAHTRWATHGTPSERNAHPHRAGDVVVVHNGIVENYVELKEHLRSKGHKFLSDTDTEVIPHLISEHMKEGAGFMEAVRLSLAEMQGSYALGIIREGEQTLIAAKKESPLVLGIGEGEFFIASDAPALIGKTNRFIFLEDNDIAVMKGGELLMLDADGNRAERQVHIINWSGAMAEKGGYKHFMMKEIFEQPRAISDTLLGRVKEERGEVDFEDLKLPPYEQGQTHMDDRLRHLVPCMPHRQAHV